MLKDAKPEHRKRAIEMASKLLAIKAAKMPRPKVSPDCDSDLIYPVKPEVIEDGRSDQPPRVGTFDPPPPYRSERTPPCPEPTSSRRNSSK